MVAVCGMSVGSNRTVEVGVVVLGSCVMVSGELVVGGGDEIGSPEVAICRVASCWVMLRVTGLLLCIQYVCSFIDGYV